MIKLNVLCIGQRCALQVLWLKSRNSEVWLDRRTTYTRSTAVMSMVGYLLGLGDRHPSNLMLDRYSGKLLHIDFGDCFEASMNRDKFPEKVCCCAGACLSMCLLPVCCVGPPWRRSLQCVLVQPTRCNLKVRYSCEPGITGGTASLEPASYTRRSQRMALCFTAACRM